MIPTRGPPAMTGPMPPIQNISPTRVKKKKKFSIDPKFLRYMADGGGQVQRGIGSVIPQSYGDSGGRYGISSTIPQSYGDSGGVADGLRHIIGWRQVNSPNYPY